MSLFLLSARILFLAVCVLETTKSVYGACQDPSVLSEIRFYSTLL